MNHITLKRHVILMFTPHTRAAGRVFGRSLPDYERYPLHWAPRNIYNIYDTMWNLWRCIIWTVSLRVTGLELRYAHANNVRCHTPFPSNSHFPFLHAIRKVPTPMVFFGDGFLWWMLPGEPRV